MKKHNGHSENHKLYYIEPYPSTVCEKPELNTWEDALELIEHVQLAHPEGRFEIKEFEPI